MSNPSERMATWFKQPFEGTPEHGSEFLDGFDLYVDFMKDILDRDDMLRILARPRSNSTTDATMRASLEMQLGEINKRLIPLDRRLAMLKAERK